MTDRRDRIVGCIVGGAVGDALGAPTEFLSTARIRETYGPNGVTTFEPEYGKPGCWTDDTQMTLFTAEGLLRAHRAVAERDLDTVAKSLHLAYLRWLSTQHKSPPWPAGHDREPTGWLIEQDVLHAWRGPGNTCLDALQDPRPRSINQRINEGKGCGGVMRAAPCGFTGADRAFDLGAVAAAVTHSHPTGHLAAGAFARIIAALVEGDALDKAVAAARDELVEHTEHEETLRSIDAALALAGREAPSPESIRSLGEGWVAEEALAIALFCAIATDDFRAGVLAAANHDGDTDSTAAICGQLLGTMHGVEVVPIEWREQVEAGDLLVQVATDLADVFVDDRPPDPDRYPPFDL